MKTISLLSAVILGTASAHGQPGEVGEVFFSNRLPGTVIAHVYLPSTASSNLIQNGNGPSDFPAGTIDWTGWTLVSGDGFSAQLFDAPGADVPVDKLVPSFPTTTFRSGLAAGFVNPVVVTLTDVSAETLVATVQMRVWDNKGGTIPDWATAVAQPSGTELLGMSAPINLAGPFTELAESLNGLQSFNLVGTMIIQANFTNVATGYPVSFLALNGGLSLWDFADGTLVTNQPTTTHAWSVPGVYTVRLTGYTNGNPSGLSASVVVTVSEAVYYVDAASSNPIPPYAGWQTAAGSIQDAIVAGSLPGRLVLVTNGGYRTGSVVLDGTNRVALTNPVVVRSVNGPRVTVIEGEAGGVRCASVGNEAILSGFTLTNGTTSGFGGGALCGFGAILTNCVLNGNTAGIGGGACYGTLYNCVLSVNSAEGAGGAYYSTLYNCTLNGNSAGSYGGGAYYGTLYNCFLTGNRAGGNGGGTLGGTLYNCVLTGNSAPDGGGCFAAALHNCTLTGNSATKEGGGVTLGQVYNSIVYFNQAPGTADSAGAVDFNYSCTTPLPSNGVGNISADPRFVNAVAGDLRLQPASPCIDAGSNLVDILATDIEGLPRVIDGNNDSIATADIGAYEFNPYRFEPALELSASGFQFTIRGEPGKLVRIEASRDLVNWEFVATVPIPAGGQTLVDPAATTAPFLFYRALALR